MPQLMDLCGWAASCRPSSNQSRRQAVGSRGRAQQAMTPITTESDAAHTGHVVLDPDRKHDPHKTRFGDFLKACIKFGASDLIMKTDQKPKIRLRGALRPLDTAKVDAEEFISIAKHILTEEQFKDLHHFGHVDFAYDY